MRRNQTESISILSQLKSIFFRVLAQFRVLLALLFLVVGLNCSTQLAFSQVGQVGDFTLEDDYSNLSEEEKEQKLEELISKALIHLMSRHPIDARGFITKSIKSRPQ